MTKSSFLSTLREAFDEGRDEGAHGAPTGKLVDAMMLAARSDRNVTKDELHLVANLLSKHFRAYETVSDAVVMNALHDATTRLDAMGDRDEQLKQVAAALRRRDAFAAEKGYALAYSVLLVDGGLNEREHEFADRFAEALGILPARRLEIEQDLEAALRGP
ncbi:MAG: TerB family tellurite resistance protein [Polyangiaceae bacterium]|nr:TerB family tellurite resistance protein [Polyangiaceae bacterium]